MSALYSTPVLFTLCALAILCAGFIAGICARTRSFDDVIHGDEAGDTHAGLPQLPEPKRSKYFAPRTPMRTADARAIERQARQLQRTALPPVVPIGAKR